jgi:transposase-like protein
VLTASPDHLRKATYSPFDCVHPTPEPLGCSTVEQRAPNQLSFSVQTLRKKENKNLAVCYTSEPAQHDSSGDRSHLDKVFLKINGQVHYLWRAVDQDEDLLDILVRSRRDEKAAKKFFHKLLKGLRYVPSIIITDKLKSYSAAKAAVMLPDWKLKKRGN